MLMGGFSHFVGHISRFFHVLQGTLQKLLNRNWIYVFLKILIKTVSIKQF